MSLLCKKVNVIVGSGIAGALAYGCFRSERPAILERNSEEEVDEHKAIMRVKDPAIGRILGCSLKKISVIKEIYHNGTLVKIPNIQMMNTYSRKVTGRIRERSVADTEECERYLLGKARFPALYDHEFIGIKENRLVAINKKENATLFFDYDWCISTIPMVVLLRILKIDIPVEFKVEPIYVLRFEIGIDSVVNQTIYVSDLCYKTYRISLQSNLLIVESVSGYPNEKELKELVNLFGLEFGSCKEISCTKQKFGKLVPIDEDLRKAIILELTEKYRIFSLGRFALWKNIRTDDLIKDLEKIRSMISVSAVSAKYLNKKG